MICSGGSLPQYVPEGVLIGPSLPGREGDRGPPEVLRAGHGWGSPPPWPALNPDLCIPKFPMENSVSVTRTRIHGSIGEYRYRDRRHHDHRASRASSRSGPHAGPGPRAGPGSGPSSGPEPVDPYIANAGCDGFTAGPHPRSPSGALHAPTCPTRQPCAKTTKLPRLLRWWRARPRPGRPGITSTLRGLRRASNGRRAVVLRAGGAPRARRGRVTELGRSVSRDVGSLCFT
jgi:hypothetical protein